MSHIDYTYAVKVANRVSMYHVKGFHDPRSNMRCVCLDLPGVYLMCS
jgi:hypothetical protein